MASNPFPELRKRVRQIMLTIGATLPWTPKAIYRVISKEPEFHDAELADVRAALVWNETENFVKKHRDAEQEVDTWTLTPEGILNTPV